MLQVAMQTNDYLDEVEKALAKLNSKIKRKQGQKLPESDEILFQDLSKTPRSKDDNSPFFE